MDGNDVAKEPEMSDLRAGKLIPDGAGRLVAFTKWDAYTLARAVTGRVIDKEINLLEGIQMQWEKPSFTDLRFGFEVTMYIYNR